MLTSDIALLAPDLDADAADAYWRNEGLDKLAESESGAAIPPNVHDLVRLHRLVRQGMACSVLEFGVGYSTVVLADALEKNELDFLALPERPELRTPKPFHLQSVDASETWIARTRERLPEHLGKRVDLCFSGVSAGTWNGRLCHFYDLLPDIVPDFVYLDGPDPKDVKGMVRGLSFQAADRTVIAADLLAMEPTLLPGTVILVDGRVNNARFLQRNFQRPFACQRLPGTDVTVFRLDEPPLGCHSHNLVALVETYRATGRRGGDECSCSMESGSVMVV